jgi:chaperone modulatory protein CbpM
MISIDVLVGETSGLDRRDLDRWIANNWVRADELLGELQFHEIDVARIRLIRELRDIFDISEDALPVVLLLLDQVYDLRRLLQSLGSPQPRPGVIRRRAIPGPWTCATSR